VFTFFTLFESALALFPSSFLDKSLSLGKLKTSFRLLSLNRDFELLSKLLTLGRIQASLVCSRLIATLSYSRSCSRSAEFKQAWSALA
jgi:hypothetical protein